MDKKKIIEMAEKQIRKGKRERYIRIILGYAVAFWVVFFYWLGDINSFDRMIGAFIGCLIISSFFVPISSLFFKDLYDANKRDEKILRTIYEKYGVDYYKGRDDECINN